MKKKKKIIVKKRRSAIPRMEPKKNLTAGEPWWVKEDFYISCCGCGLRHHVTVDKEVQRRGDSFTVAPNDKWLLLKFYTDPTATDVIRHERKIKVVSTGRRKKK